MQHITLRCMFDCCGNFAYRASTFMSGVVLCASIYSFFFFFFQLKVSNKRDRKTWRGYGLIREGASKLLFTGVHDFMYFCIIGVNLTLLAKRKPFWWASPLVFFMSWRADSFRAWAQQVVYLSNAFHCRGKYYYYGFAAARYFSLVYIPHKSWYSWGIQCFANGVYAFGFLFMLPQLFVNYRMKSVAHLPWRAFMYKVGINFRLSL